MAPERRTWNEHSVIWLLPWLLGCPCPAPACDAWVGVDLRAGTWASGTWTVRVQAEGLDLDCRITVPPSVGAPTLRDVDCNGRIQVDQVVLDTAGPWETDHLELRAPITDGTRPAEVQVTVTLDAGEGPVPYVEGSRALTWRPIAPTRGTCSADCAAGDLELDLSSPAPAQLQSTAPSGRK